MKNYKIQRQARHLRGDDKLATGSQREVNGGLKDSSFLAIASVAFITLLVMGCHQQEDSPSRPNVVLILADDQGWGDLSSNGNTFLKTPVLDSLSKEGASFTNFYVSPLCAPTRASMLTGRHFLRTGTSWVTKGLETMRSDEVTIAEIFKASGYQTGCFGKWHNGAHYPENPIGQGFDEFLGFCAGHLNNYFDEPLEHNGIIEPTKGFVTDVLTDAALRFIEKNKNQNFFCYIPYNVPHSPHQVPDDYFDTYKAQGLSDELSAVYGMCANMDDNVGRILKKLIELKLDDNTIVVFLSDNGPNGHRYNGGMRGIKGSAHEGGTRTPFFIRWPSKIKGGAKVDNIAAHIDILPTLASLCSVPLPDSLALDGKDLTPLLMANTVDFRRNIYEVLPTQHASMANGAVRTQTHRLVLEKGDTMLFDMIHDHGETTNIAHENKSLTSQLLADYSTWYRDLNYHSVDYIPVGHSASPAVTLLAPEAKFHGELSFKEGNGWANDWITHWTSKADTIAWDIDVNTPGTYQVTLLYTCEDANVGSRISMISSNDKQSFVLNQPFVPAQIESPDRVKRKEAYEQTWGKVDAGTLHFIKGKQSFLLTAELIKGKEVGELKGVMLTLR